MNTSAHLDLRREVDQVKENRSTPGADAVPQEFGSNEQARRENSAGRYVSDEGPFETFVDGAGI